MRTSDVSAADLVAALDAQQWQTVRAGVVEAASWLRSNPREDVLADQLRARLVELSAHDKWEVRKAVVEALQFVRDDRVPATLARMLDDDNAYVRDAAKRAIGRLTALSRADLLKEEHDDLLAEWLSELAAAHGPRARDEAVRVARKYVELFIGEVRHEIARVIGKLELSLVNLQTQLAKPQIDGAICLQHVARARARIDMLSAMTKLLGEITAEIRPEFESAALRALVEEAVELVDRTKYPGITVELDVDNATRVDAHRFHLLAAFTNIVQNAFEAYEAGAVGTIAIVARGRESDLVITFTDQGRGMTDEVRRDAFRLFSTGKPEHLGFGLPLARKLIVNLHRGAIDLASRIGQGTTVTVVLPLKQETE